MEFPTLVVDMICIVELGPKEEHAESGVGIIDDCMMVVDHNNFHSGIGLVLQQAGYVNIFLSEENNYNKTGLEMYQHLGKNVQLSILGCLFEFVTSHGVPDIFLTSF